jgi:hypothetical protein
MDASDWEVDGNAIGTLFYPVAASGVKRGLYH